MQADHLQMTIWSRCGAGVRACAAALLAVPALASAQTSVTAYGRFDISAEALRFGATATRAASTLKTLTSDASHWGLRASEDLGGGLRASFKLEAGIQLDTGAQTTPAAFNRESYVALSDARWGSVQLGSQWAPGLWQSLKADPFQRVGSASPFALMQTLPGLNARGYTLRYDNAVQLINRSLPGVTARLYAAAGEGAAAGRAQALSIDFEQGPLYLGVFHERTRSAAATVGLTGPPVDHRLSSLAATVKLAAVTLHAQGQRSQIDTLGNADVALLGVSVPLGVGEFKASTTRRRAGVGGVEGAALHGVGYFHPLSLRTRLYATVARLNNRGSAALRVGPALGEQAALGAAGPVAGQDTTACQVGLRHVF